jgi:Tfp pilus assembly protein PilO
MTASIAVKEIQLNQLNSQSKDILGLQQRQKETQKQNAIVLDTIRANIESMKMGNTTHEQVVSYMGYAASLTGVSVTTFKVLPVDVKDGVTKTPYEVTVEGKYSDITAFTDMMYKFDKYIYIDGMYMKNIYKFPMTDKVQGGSSSLASHITDTWGKGFLAELDKQIPNTILKPAESKATTDQLPIANEDSKIKKVVQIQIKFGTLTTE